MLLSEHPVLSPPLRESLLLKLKLLILMGLPCWILHWHQDALGLSTAMLSAAC
jgi:hypothetical protein